MYIKKYVVTSFGFATGVFISSYYLADSGLTQALGLTYHCFFSGITVGFFSNGE